LTPDLYCHLDMGVSFPGSPAQKKIQKRSTHTGSQKLKIIINKKTQLMKHS